MDAVEEVKSRLNIEDVVSEYVQLKRAGRNFKGLSPFTAERTPSFMVSPEKGIWHDFSSGKGGNVFSFIMEVEGLEFKEALELLARKANVDLAQYRGGNQADRSKHKERLYAVLELAAKFYQVQFSRSTITLDYVFRKRAFSKETALAFRLGYAPNTGNALLEFLKSRGFTEAEATSAGLTAKRYRGGIQDMFRGRLMIPLQDQSGRVIGFTARLLADEPNAPKYINTPQTVLYDKSRHIYGLHLAKQALRQQQFAVLVEGNLDVIASHQAGVAVAVATAGTALTESHLKGISRFTPDIRLAFDQDAAGQAAAERAIPIASKVGVSLSMIVIPAGKDPDELIRKDPTLWIDAIQRPQYALDWLIDRYSAQLDLTSAPGKRQFSDVLLAVIRQLNDEVEQDHYIGKIADIMSISKAALLRKLTSKTAEDAPRLKPPKVAPTKDRQPFHTARNEQHLACLLLMKPFLRPYADKLPLSMLHDVCARSVLEFIRQYPDFNGNAEVLQQLFDKAADVQQLKDYVKILQELFEDKDQGYSEVDDTTLVRSVAALCSGLIRNNSETKTGTQKDELTKLKTYYDQLLDNPKGV